MPCPLTPLTRVFCNDLVYSEMRTAIDKLQKQAPLKALLVDLRGNPGGLLTSAVDVAEAFLDPKSPIVSTKGRTSAAPTLSYNVIRPPPQNPPVQIDWIDMSG